MRQTTRTAAEAAAACGCAIGQIVKSLIFLGGRSGKPYLLSPTQLYEALMISSGGMTNRLDRLERAGLVERRPDPDDRRGKLIALTDAGKRVIDDTIGRHVANEQRLLSVLTRAEQEKLNALLKKLITAL